MSLRLAACLFGRRFWGGNVVTHHSVFLFSWLRHSLLSWLATFASSRGSRLSHFSCAAAPYCAVMTLLCLPLLGLCKAAPCLTHAHSHMYLTHVVRSCLFWAIRPFVINTRVEHAVSSACSTSSITLFYIIRSKSLQAHYSLWTRIVLGL